MPRVVGMHEPEHGESCTVALYLQAAQTNCQNNVTHPLPDPVEEKGAFVKFDDPEEKCGGECVM